MTLGKSQSGGDAGDGVERRSVPQGHGHLHPPGRRPPGWSDVMKKKLAGARHAAPDRRRRRRCAPRRVPRAHFVVAPQGAKAAKIQTQIDATQAQIYQRKRRPEGGGHPPTIAVADLFKLSRAMPDRSDMPGIILTLSQVAREAGISFQLIEPVAGAPTDTTASGYQTAAHPPALQRRLLRAERLPLPPAQPRRRPRRQARRDRPALQHRHGHLQRPAGRIPEHLRRAVRERVRLPACRRPQQRRRGTTTDPGTTTTPSTDTAPPPSGATAAGVNP